MRNKSLLFRSILLLLASFIFTSSHAQVGFPSPSFQLQSMDRAQTSQRDAFHYNNSFIRSDYRYKMYGPCKVRTLEPRIDIQEGGVAALANHSSFNLVYFYDMSVDKQATQEEYLAMKTKRYKKDTALANQFQRSWFQNQKAVFEPGFEYAFNESGSRNGVSGTNHGNSSITIEIRTTRTNTGSDIFIKNPTYVNMECVFKDAAGNILLRYSIMQAGIPYDKGVDESSRIAECYTKAAEMLSEQLKKL